MRGQLIVFQSCEGAADGGSHHVRGQLMVVQSCEGPADGGSIK